LTSPPVVGVGLVVLGASPSLCERVLGNTLRAQHRVNRIAPWRRQWSYEKFARRTRVELAVAGVLFVGVGAAAIAASLG